MLKKYIVDLHPRVENLLVLYKRPLTIIHSAADSLPSYLTNSDKTIAIRITTNNTLKALINKINQPIVSTSANLEGHPSPSTFSDIQETIKDQVDYIFLAGRDSTSDGQSSTIVKYTSEGELIFLR